jgi:hypothetical protein
VIGVARLSRWRAILLSAGVPLVLSLAVLYPLTEHQRVGLSEYREQIIFAVDSARWLAYGVALTAFLPLLPHLRRVEPEEGAALPAGATPGRHPPREEAEG